jgi:hypothetical protein
MILLYIFFPVDLTVNKLHVLLHTNLFVSFCRALLHIKLLTGQVYIAEVSSFKNGDVA